MAYKSLYDDFFGASTGSAGTEELRRAAKAAGDATRQLQNMQEYLNKKTAEMTREMASDGLLDTPVATEAIPEEKPAHPNAGSWENMDTALAGKLLGQEALLAALTRAFRRATLLPPEGEGAKNVIYISGGEGSGRHTALRLVTEELAARGLLKEKAIAAMDLSLYPGPAQEKLFLQDLYGALNAPGEVVIFDNWDACAPGCRAVLGGLVEKGSAPLNSRYLLQKGILIESGTALAGNTVSALTPKGKYLVFFGRKGPESLAASFGAGFIGHLNDFCATADYAPETLAAIAAGQLNELAARAKTRLAVTLKADAAVRDWLAGRYCKASGVEGMAESVEKLYRALAELKLTREPAAGTTVTLQAAETGLQVVLGEEILPLESLLPTGFTAERAQAEADLNEVVGLAEVKEYVRALADNVAAQTRRKAAGLPVGSLNMHMIFAGNPGTGKTTIARIISRYLKAMGVLRGGQLVEVSRADLVGRYVGHTAPLTNSVIQSALGGVLFIDEAYSLYRGREDSFGLEAIDTLVKGIEDHRDDLVVVLAGYSREMEEFLTANSGLASRFPNHIEFPDYSAEELLAITKSIAKGKGYRLDDACALPLHAYFERRQATDPATAGNGRMARNMLEKAILNQSRRLAADAEAALDLLLPGDFETDSD